MKPHRSQYAPPVVVFGTGGSGTRGLQRLLDTAGYFMGANVNRPGDALDIAWFIRRWVDPYLSRSRWVDEMWRDGDAKRFRFPGRMAADFQATIEDHREAIGRRRRRWGWKVPRTILVFPFVHEFFPVMRAIHLVRDGRDMAYSANQNQARRYADVLNLSVSELSAPIQSISFWAHVNLAAARYGERALGDRYLRLRYEDVCADPTAMAARLVDFLDSPASLGKMQGVAAAEIKPSSSYPTFPTLQHEFLPFLAEFRSGHVEISDGYQYFLSQMRPYSRGRIRLKSSAPMQRPLICFNYLSDRRDIQEMIDGVRKTLIIAHESAWDNYRQSVLDPVRIDSSDDEIVGWMRAIANTEHHPTSTCRMGTDNMSVTDNVGSVHGLDHLRIVDGSILPRIPTGNINAAIIMVAEKISDAIRGKN